MQPCLTWHCWSNTSAQWVRKHSWACQQSQPSLQQRSDREAGLLGWGGVQRVHLSLQRVLLAWSHSHPVGVGPVHDPAKLAHVQPVHQLHQPHQPGHSRQAQGAAQGSTCRIDAPASASCSRGTRASSQPHWTKL